MNGLRGFTDAYPALATWATWWHRLSAVYLVPARSYLRGLTAARVGLVALICAIFTARQLSNCIFATGCGIPDGNTPAGFALFLVRQILCALPMLFAVTIADNATIRSPSHVRIIALGAAVVLGATIYGAAFLYSQPPNVVAGATGRRGLFILTYAARALLYGGLATALLYLYAREREGEGALHAARMEKTSLDRQMIEARLQALQAQIEPHFLFNTLANIKLLYETDPSHAKPLIRDLAAYLRIALPQMRDVRSTLARELELAQAYLRVLKVRMGERLHVVSEVPESLWQATIPPMIVLTLVENAIKHGLASLPHGGTITLRAERIAEGIRVSVIDDGIGFPKGFGAGTGLANTRSRLTALYGDAGRLTLRANACGGVIAEIELPFEPAATMPAAT